MLEAACRAAKDLHHFLGHQPRDSTVTVIWETMPEQTSSLLWLWILQIGWWLGWMLPLALAGVLIALGPS